MIFSSPKKLIIDANILFSFFKPDSARKYIIEELLNLDCELISPSFVIEELLADKEKIKRFSGLNETEFIALFSLLKDEIRIIPESKYESFLYKANKLSPHGKDTKDDPYFVLSLAIDKTPIWSDEKAFKEQSEIKILTTLELLTYLKSSA